MQTYPNQSSNDDGVLQAMERAQRTAYAKGVVALIGVAAGIAFLLIGFSQMATL